jgi:hypothetical protein
MSLEVLQVRVSIQMTRDGAPRTTAKVRITDTMSASNF